MASDGSIRLVVQHVPIDVGLNLVILCVCSGAFLTMTDGHNIFICFCVCLVLMTSSLNGACV